MLCLYTIHLENSARGVSAQSGSSLFLSRASEEISVIVSTVSAAKITPGTGCDETHNNQRRNVLAAALTGYAFHERLSGARCLVNVDTCMIIAALCYSGAQRIYLRACMAAC